MFAKLRDLTDPHRAAVRKRSAGEPKGEPDDRALAKHQEEAFKRLSEELDKKAQPKWNDIELKNESWPEPAIVEQLENARGICSDRFAFCQTLPLEDFHRLASDLEPWGYRPSCVRPYTADGKVLVAAAWLRDGLGWKFEKDMTAREVEQKNEEYRARMGEVRQRVLAGRPCLLRAAAQPRRGQDARSVRRSSHGTRRSGSRPIANRTAG